MFILQGSRTNLVLILMVATLGCDTLENSPPGIEQSAACQLGCNETDPNPSAPGIFLGSGITDLTCFDGEQTDADGDGMSDFCENNLAPRFSPQLAISTGDEVGREPHFATRQLSTTKARIMYLLSYYVDRGPSTSWCNNNIIDVFSREACHGHDGDSEWITLDVYYDRGTKHWVLDQAIYSQHTGSKAYTRGTGASPRIEYPNKTGGSPRAYVAYQKHANYASDSECDAGSILGTDTCNANSYEQVTAGGNVNIRSRAAHTSSQDCMRSTNPLYSGNGVVECYWTSRAFVGWHIGSPASNSEYSGKLASMGF